MTKNLNLIWCSIIFCAFIAHLSSIYYIINEWIYETISIARHYSSPAMMRYARPGDKEPWLYLRELETNKRTQILNKSKYDKFPSYWGDSGEIPVPQWDSGPLSKRGVLFLFPL